MRNLKIVMHFVLIVGLIYSLRMMAVIAKLAFQKRVTAHGNVAIVVQDKAL